MNFLFFFMFSTKFIIIKENIIGNPIKGIIIEANRLFKTKTYCIYLLYKSISSSILFFAIYDNININAIADNISKLFINFLLLRIFL